MCTIPGHLSTLRLIMVNGLYIMIVINIRIGLKRPLHWPIKYGLSRQLVFGNRFSCSGTFCQEYVVFQDGCFSTAVVSQQVSLCREWYIFASKLCFVIGYISDQSLRPRSTIRVRLRTAQATMPDSLQIGRCDCRSLIRRLGWHKTTVPSGCRTAIEIKVGFVRAC